MRPVFISGLKSFYDLLRGFNGNGHSPNINRNIYFVFIYRDPGLFLTIDFSLRVC